MQTEEQLQILCALTEVVLQKFITNSITCRWEGSWIEDYSRNKSDFSRNKYKVVGDVLYDVSRIR